MLRDWCQFLADGPVTPLCSRHRLNCEYCIPVVWILPHPAPLKPLCGLIWVL